MNSLEQSKNSIYCECCDEYYNKSNTSRHNKTHTHMNAFKLFEKVKTLEKENTNLKQLLEQNEIRPVNINEPENIVKKCTIKRIIPDDENRCCARVYNPIYHLDRERIIFTDFIPLKKMRDDEKNLYGDRCKLKRQSDKFCNLHDLKYSYYVKNKDLSDFFGIWNEEYNHTLKNKIEKEKEINDYVQRSKYSIPTENKITFDELINGNTYKNKSDDLKENIVFIGSDKPEPEPTLENNSISPELKLDKRICKIVKNQINATCEDLEKLFKLNNEISKIVSQLFNTTPTDREYENIRKNYTSLFDQSIKIKDKLISENKLKEDDKIVNDINLVFIDINVANIICDYGGIVNVEFNEYFTQSDYELIKNELKTRLNILYKEYNYN